MPFSPVLLTAGVTLLGAATAILAQADAATATPTTIVGAFIAVCVSVIALVSWIVRHLLTVTLPQATTASAAGLKDVAQALERLHDKLDEVNDNLSQMNAGLRGVCRHTGKDG